MHEALDTLIASLNIGYKTEFTPASKVPPQTDGWECATWQVTLTRGAVSLSTPYHMGIACLTGLPSGRRSVAVAANIKHALETGKYPADWHADNEFNRHLRHWKTIPAPKLRDVLYSLVQDANAIDYDSFESWAAEYNYDSDSRAAERAYRACLDIALKLRAMLGDTVITELREVFQDY